MNSTHLSIGALAPQGVPVLLYAFPHMPPDVAATISTAVAGLLIAGYMLAQRIFPKILRQETSVVARVHGTDTPVVAKVPAAV